MSPKAIGLLAAATVAATPRKARDLIGLLDANEEYAAKADFPEPEEPPTSIAMATQPLPVVKRGQHASGSKAAYGAAERRRRKRKMERQSRRKNRK